MVATQDATLYLYRRGRTWQFRRRIPSALVSALGRVAFSRSLHTNSLREARRRAVQLNARLEGALDLMQAGSPVNADDLVRRLCNDYLRWLVEEDRRKRAVPGVTKRDIAQMPGIYDVLVAEERDRMWSGDRFQAHQLLERAGVHLESEDFDRPCVELQRTLLRTHRICEE